MSKHAPVLLKLALCPPAITLHLVGRVESIAPDQTGGKAKRHRRIIGPLSGLKPERATAHHVSERFERAPRPQFSCRANRVANRKPQEATMKTRARFALSHEGNYRTSIVFPVSGIMPLSNLLCQLHRTPNARVLIKELFAIIAAGVALLQITRMRHI